MFTTKLFFVGAFGKERETRVDLILEKFEGNIILRLCQLSALF
jgi:hypothetical protein